jgi:NADPH:quinone reductase-like Zn-dependent oxidoreductase
MKTYEIDRTGSIDNIRAVERTRPQPGFQQVLIKVRAVALNYRDLMNVRGTFGPLSRPRLIPVSDGAGEVVESGTGATRFKPGDRVIPIFRQNWISGRYEPAGASSDLGGGLDGMLSEYVVMAEHGLVQLPSHLSFEEGATLPCAAVTAWNAVVSRGCTRVGETVLVQGSGGVSLFAMQFARASGARVIATTSTDEKARRLRALGADEVVNYKSHPEWHAEVLKLTAGRGVDVVVETGGPGTWAKSIAAAAVGGRVLLAGLLTGIEETASGPVFMPIFMRETMVTSVHVGSREMFEDMNRTLLQHQLHPVIDKVFAFEQVHEAYRYLESGAHFGKVVISVP